MTVDVELISRGFLVRPFPGLVQPMIDMRGFHHIAVAIPVERLWFYRCHTGHAYSTRTLLAETDTEIEKSFWSAVRAIEERSFLLRTEEQRARAAGQGALADRLGADAARDEAQAQGVRRLAVERGQREPTTDDAATRLRRRLATAGARGGQSEP